MANRYARLAKTPIPQTEPLNARQVKNNAGGFVFQLDDWGRLMRFITIGSDSNTYYQKAPQLTRENAACVQRCWDADPVRTAHEIVAISDEGRAPKNDAAIFALALGACNHETKTRQIALAELQKVCRTATHLFQFVGQCIQLGRGWGPTLKKAVAAWYESKTVDQVAFQAIKYRSREKYTHKRLLETARPFPGNDRENMVQERTNLYRWMKGKGSIGPLPELIAAHETAMAEGTSQKELLALIKEYRLPWEAIPTAALKDPKVWETMLPHLGLTAVIRNLGSMTANGALKPLGKSTAQVIELLGDEKQLHRARIHPFNVLKALAAYRSGGSMAARRFGKSGLSWEPIPAVEQALEEAFYASFKTVVPSGKRILIGLDVSGSMSSPLMDSPLSVCEGASAMAMSVLRTEKNWHVHAFADGFRALPLKPSMSLDQVLKHTRNVNFGGTDCALPMVYAAERGLEVDVFQVFTDNETWFGGIHPCEALKRYRQQTGINAKLVVVGMTSTGFTIADPSDPGMLDVVGFDSAAPAVMANFARR